jgi:hypothetical protein
MQLLLKTWSMEGFVKFANTLAVAIEVLSPVVHVFIGSLKKAMEDLSSCRGAGIEKIFE